MKGRYRLTNRQPGFEHQMAVQERAEWRVQQIREEIDRYNAASQNEDDNDNVELSYNIAISQNSRVRLGIFLKRNDGDIAIKVC